MSTGRVSRLKCICESVRWRQVYKQWARKNISERSDQHSTRLYPDVCSWNAKHAKKKKRERIKLNLVVCGLVFIPFWPLQNPNMRWEIHEMLNIKFTVRPGRETIKETTLWRFLSGFNGSVDTRRALAADGQTKSCKLLLFVVVDLGIETLWWPELTMDEQLVFINGLVTAKTGQKHFLFAPRVRKWSSRYTVWSPSSAGNWRSGSQGRTMCRRQSRTCFSSSSL